MSMTTDSGVQKKLMLDDEIRGEIRDNESMARHTSWRVGGPADVYFRPADIDDLARFIGGLDKQVPVFWLGLGSNLLVRDGGIRGVVISTSGLLNAMDMRDDGVIRVEAGVSCAKVARFCADHERTAAGFLIGIPGTMGGALAMNAGAFGGETWQLVTAVETLDRQGGRHLRRPGEYEIGYRHVNGPAAEWFLAAHLDVPLDAAGQDREPIRDLLARRSEQQPIGQPSSGSVFRNPEGDFAGRLIEASGLKGFCIGGACVSEKHANFIINTGSATAHDIETLINHVRDTVEQQQGIRLVPEVHIVGEAGND